jgi:hypothetical protein
LQLLCIQQNSFAQDTIPVTPKVTKPIINTTQNTLKKSAKVKFSPEPLKATMMAVAFPGLGQIYNRKLWKIPVVYAGFGGLIYAVGFNSKYYNKYMKAFQDFSDTSKETKSYLTLFADPPSTYDPVLYPGSYSPASASNVKDRLLQAIDNSKSNRDLSYIGIAAWYLFSILDANVDASLFNYDISRNLDIAVFPSQVPLPGGYMGAGVNVGVTITF